MTRQEYIDEFIKKWGPAVPLNFRGSNYSVSVTYLAKHRVNKTLLECADGKWEPLCFTNLKPQIPEEEIVNLISVIQGAPAAQVGIYKLPDDPLGIVRVSLGGDTQEAVYVQYRGDIHKAVRMTEICLELLKKQAEKGEAPPPPTYEGN